MLKPVIHLSFNQVIKIAMIPALVSLTGCFGSSSSSSTPSGGTSGVTLSGNASGNATDVAAVATLYDKAHQWLIAFNPVSSAWAVAKTGATGNTALPGATVTLHKVFGNGQPSSQVDIGTVTTDSSGNFSIPNVEKAPDGSGADSDFYYEIRITKGTLELRAPAAPSATDTVNVTPESNLAAKLLSDVVSVPGDSTPPIPEAQAIEAIREGVIADAGALVDNKSISIPTAAGTGADTNLIATANGVASGGGNTEKLFKAAEFNAEFLSLKNNPSKTDGESAAFVSRVIRESCDQKSGDYLPGAISDAMGTFFNATDNTVTPQEIITAYNNNNGTGADLVAQDKLDAFKTLLSGLDTQLGADADSIGDISQDQQVALYVKRDLDSSTLTLSTELTIDQAAAFIQTLNPGGNKCELESNLDLFGFFADLLGDSSLRTKAIAESQIYHNSGFGCNEGAGQGHFVADILAYPGSKTISSVTIASDDTDSTILGGTNPISLTNSTGNHWTSNSNGVCVNLGKTVNYTVTVNFSDTTTASRTVTRNHPRIPQATSAALVSGSFTNLSNISSSPTVVAVKRPVVKWDRPAVMLDNIINDSANTAVSSTLASSKARVKYTYEFSHIDKSASSPAPLTSCDSVLAGRMYPLDNFIPTKDCDVSACSTASGVAVTDVACRVNIQTYYVSRKDKILGQAAGEFTYFCVDTDSDGNCG